MIQISTQNLLTLHAYGETSESQKQMLSDEIAANPELHQNLIELIKVKRQLNTKMVSPSETSIRIIMNHSHRTEHLQEI